MDMACNFLMDEYFTEALKLPLIQESAPWMYKDDDGSMQVNIGLRECINDWVKGGLTEWLFE
jgi:hypothetical protein